MHIADMQFGDDFYEVDFDLDNLAWGLHVTRPEYNGTLSAFYNNTKDLMTCIRVNCPPVFESMVRDELEGD